MEEPPQKVSALDKAAPVLSKVIFYCSLGAGLFVTFAGLFGFVGWYAYPAKSRWDALGVGVFAGVVTFAYWKLSKMQSD